MCNGEPSDPAWNTRGWSRQFDGVPIPSLNLDTLGLTPFGKMLAKAAQQYAFSVRDRTGVPLMVYAESWT